MVSGISNSTLSIFLLLLFLLGCGKDHNSNIAAHSSTSLLSIEITPANIAIPLGLSGSYTAIGIYSDSTQKDLTADVIWNSSNTNVATINRQVDGVVMAKACVLGVATITATLDTMSASTTLTVSAAVLQTIEIWPTDLPMAIGADQRFYANGIFSDGSTRDITDLANWTASDAAIATVSRSQDGFTNVHSFSAGQAMIYATYSGQSSSTTVYVLSIQTLAAGYDDLSRPVVGIDGMGNITTVWQNWLAKPDVFLSARFDNEKGWLPTSTIATNSTNGSNFNMAFNENGQGLLVWSSPQGSFYANYSTVDGWQTPQVFSQDISLVPLQVTIDSSGNGLATWSYAGKVYTSEYTLGATWSAPKEQGPSGSSGMNPRLSVNSNGDAVLLWQQWDLANTGDWTIHVATFDHQSGWTQPTVIYTSTEYSTPCAAINDQGRVVVVWTDNANFQVLSSWYIPSQGWQPTQILKTGIYPGVATVAIDSLGNAIAIWPDNYDTRVYANYYTESQGWGSAVVMRDPTPGYGDTSSHQVKMDAQGNAIALWLVDSIIEIKRFNRLSGWQENEFLGGLKEAGVDGFSCAMNSSGEAVIIWKEGYSLWDKQYSSYHNVEDLYIAVFSIF